MSTYEEKGLCEQLENSVDRVVVNATMRHARCVHGGALVMDAK